MITDADVKKLKNVFATKKELEATTIELVKYIGEVKTELKNDILDFKDQIMHELNKIRDDITVVVGYRDRIEDHEVRIETLEAKI